jgi:hypothetical protein
MWSQFDCGAHRTRLWQVQLAEIEEGLHQYAGFRAGRVPVNSHCLIYGGELMLRTGSIYMGPKDEQDELMVRCAS